MIFAVRLEMILELQNSLAQNRYLDLWRTGIGFVDPIISNNFFLSFSRQCHSRKDTPRLNLYLLLFFIRIAQIALGLGQ